MKLNVKSLMLVLGTGIVFSLSGCGGGGSSTPTDTEPGPGELGYQTILPDGSIEYVDYTGGTKIAPPSAADAEYHTGLGYGNTLFDSADNKCMNCHNELYDTWKNSMHGQSWTDPIFQSKFQDFLRTHINKIDENKTAVGGIVYTEAMIPKVAQTCIKCHAPGAYYAGDFNATLEKVGDDVDTGTFDTLKATYQTNLATPTTKYDPTLPATVVAVSHTNGDAYKLTYQIGHEANREGINCAFCHSIETPRLMKSSIDGALDNGEYTLAKDMRVGPHGPIKAAAGTTLEFDKNASDPDMNKFFRLWGPEKYHTNTSDNAYTPKDDFDVTDPSKTADGRYTMASKDINGTGGKVHFTGGPFYGPYGVTGISNENETDETNRSALVNPHYDMDGNNHFGESGKGLCLSCHQRSAGAAVPKGEDGQGSFMELCSTQMAVTTGEDTPSGNTDSSPKCQKCHMERIEGTVLHQWARPDKLFTLADNPALTGHFDPEDPDGYGDDNPVAAGWLNSHSFLGASKTFADTTRKASATAKIQSGFDASLEVLVNDGNLLVISATLANKTAHMFPGAHPMRRVLSRVIVTDGVNPIEYKEAFGSSSFTDIQNNVQPLLNKTLHASAYDTVLVEDAGSDALDFPGKAPDLNGSSVSSQKFKGNTVTIKGADSTILNQYITDSGATEGNVTNAAIVDSEDKSNFTRIYGHETGKKYDGEFIVRPGFDSNMVANDNRLSPNETETYILTYDISGVDNVEIGYRVYYMQKGANGKFLTGDDGWLNQALSDSKKLLVTEVYRYPEAF